MTAVTSFENTISDTGLLRENDHEGGLGGGGAGKYIRDECEARCCGLVLI